MIMKLTPAEVGTIAKIILEGHRISEISKDDAEFRVYFYYNDGVGYGSRAIIYNLRKSWNKGVKEIARRERELALLKNVKAARAGLIPESDWQ